MKRLLFLFTTLGLLTGVAKATFGQMIAANSTSVRDKDAGITVKANYPNPFQDQTTISFSTTRPQTVKITLYNIVGSRISTLLDQPLEAGDHEIVFKRPDNLSDGIYIYTIESGNTSRSMRMIIRK